MNTELRVPCPECSAPMCTVTTATHSYYQCTHCAYTSALSKLTKETTNDKATWLVNVGADTESGWRLIKEFATKREALAYAYSRKTAVRVYGPCYALHLNAGEVL